jgi:phage terminase small subunit
MLTPKQEKFVQNIIEGMTQADAYRNSYNAKRMSDKTIHENASRLMADSKIKARVKELREQIDKNTIMSVQERLETLTKMARDKEENTANKIRAIDTMNKMTGEYETKIVGTVSIGKLEDLL